jgi:pimeloyl-ACP methyl ester carboxylesterase
MRVLIGALALLGACAGALALVYRQDMARAYERIGERSRVIASPLGDIEYLEGGGATGVMGAHDASSATQSNESARSVGPAVLVVHGSGGGYDQGELLAHAALGRNTALRWVAPSRFGYLRSALPAGATFDTQAQAFAHLLNHLGIEQVAVVALSHGGPSALLFAALYPDRVSSLTLISAGVATSAVADQAEAHRKGSALMAIFQQDWRYWAMTHALRGWFLELMGVSAEVAAGLTPAQKQLADEVIDFMNPVSPRAAGTVFDNRAAMPNERIAAIRAPTLILHARDDGLQLFHNAEFAAGHIAGARLVSFERGGHLLLAVEQAAVQAKTVAHIRAHFDAATTERARP